MIKYHFTDGYHGLMDGYGYVDGYQDGYYDGYCDGYSDGYTDGYNFISCYISGEVVLRQPVQNIRQGYEHQLNIKLTEEDMKNILEINKVFFENEASNSMLGRILIRKGITFYQKINNNLT